MVTVGLMAAPNTPNSSAAAIRSGVIGSASTKLAAS